MKYKYLLFLISLIFLTFGLGITYSFFHTTSIGKVDQKIAKFVFNTEKTDILQIPISSINPGDNNEYEFYVSNSKDEITSQVTIEYQMTIKTYHLVPLLIELYKVESDKEKLIMTCDETYSRNDSNELVCNAPLQEMSHEQNLKDNYKLKVSFPSEYNDEVYSGLVDYIDMEIKSYQKL